MKWNLSTPKCGDMGRVKLGTIYHYGIFSNENQIVQFGLAPVARRAIKDSDVEVLTSNVDEFLCGGFLEVGEIEKKDGKPVRKGKKIIEYALEKLGQSAIMSKVFYCVKEGFLWRYCLPLVLQCLPVCFCPG